MNSDVIRADAEKLKLLAAMNLVLVQWSLKWSLYWVRGWGAGPESYVALETQWFLLTVRLRLRLRHKPRLFFGRRFWWRDELARHEKRIALLTSDISNEQLEMELKKLEVAHG